MSSAAIARWTSPDAVVAIQEANNRNDKLRAIYAAVLSAPAAEDAAVVDALCPLVDDPDPGIRQSLIVATGYRPWPGLISMVRELRDRDPVDHVRENARILLEGIEKSHLKG